MDKYDGMHKPETVSYSVEYQVRDRGRLKSGGVFRRKFCDGEGGVNNETMKADKKIFLGVRLGTCFLLLFFPFFASFTDWGAARTVSDFLRRELTREVNLPFLDADADDVSGYYPKLQGDGSVKAKNTIGIQI